MRTPEFPNVGTQCWNHPAVPAEAICVVCGKPVCADCSVRVERGILCEDTDHKLVLEHWAILFRSHSEFETDMIVRNLEYEGVETRRYSSRAFKLTTGENSRNFVQVFVRQGDFVRAQSAMTKLGLPGTEDVIQESKEEGPDIV